MEIEIEIDNVVDLVRCYLQNIPEEELEDAVTAVRQLIADRIGATLM